MAKLILTSYALLLTAATAAGQAALATSDAEVKELREGITFIPLIRPNCLALKGDVAWCGTYRGLYSYDANSRKLHRHSEAVIVDIVAAEDVWVLDASPRIRRFKPGDGVWQDIPLPQAVEDGGLNCLEWDGEALWIGLGATLKQRGRLELYRFNVADGTWQRYPYQPEKSESAPGCSDLRVGSVKRLRAIDEELIVFGNARTYRFNKRPGKWTLLRTRDEKRQAVRDAFEPPALPFDYLIGWHCTNNIDRHSRSWLSPLGVPESFKERVLCFALDDKAVWLGTWHGGLVRFTRGSSQLQPITTTDFTIVDLDRTARDLWIVVDQKGVLRIDTRRSWEQFDPIGLSDVTPSRPVDTLVGLVEIGDQTREPVIIAGWKARKRSYYLVRGSKTDQIRNHAGKIVTVTGRATLIREFGWGGGEYQLEVEDILEVSPRE